MTLDRMMNDDEKFTREKNVDLSGRGIKAKMIFLSQMFQNMGLV